tara:strand:- start:516 stop:764 length:249 start_codon:yes stop_codon:yes gene_type:complete
MNNSDFEDKLLSAGLTKQSFSNLTNVPIKTISNWLITRKGKAGKTPNWVKAYLNLYIENNQNKIFNEKLIEELKKDNKSVEN